jgi:hypothetical protein
LDQRQKLKILKLSSKGPKTANNLFVVPCEEIKEEQQVNSSTGSLSSI